MPMRVANVDAFACDRIDVADAPRTARITTTDMNMTIVHKPGDIVGWPVFSSPSQFPESPLSKALQQPLLLGLFLPIQAGGWSASTLSR